MNEHLRIIGFDPAIKNFGWSCIEIRNTSDAYRVLRCGLVENTVNNLTDRLDQDMRGFVQEIDFLFDNFKPDLTTIERFQNRSRLGASQTEKCNLMIGIILMRAQSINAPARGVTAGAWKNKIMSKHDLKGFYATARKQARIMSRDKGLSKATTKTVVNMTPHVIDSTIMTLMLASEFIGEKELFLIDGRLPQKVCKALLSNFKNGS